MPTSSGPSPAHAATVKLSTSPVLFDAIRLRWSGRSAQPQSSQADRVHHLHHPLARARPEPAGRAMAPPAPRRFLFRLFAGGVAAIERTIDVDRPLPSQGVGFDNPRFAAALRLGC